MTRAISIAILGALLLAGCGTIAPGTPFPPIPDPNPPCAVCPPGGPVPPPYTPLPTRPH